MAREQTTRDSELRILKQKGPGFASLNGNLYARGRTTFYEPSGSVITSGTSRGTLNLTHGVASGGSSILFQSVNNPDY